jgi:tocopherol O-methyltransferase
MIAPRTALSSDAIAAHYDELDRFYRAVWGEHVHHGVWITGRERADVAVRHLIDLVAQTARIEAGDVVCDVGCGYGGTSRVLAREYGARVTALTISDAQLAYASAVDGSAFNPVYVLRDWLDNGLPTASFDAVIAIESSEHVADKTAFFREISRVIKPGGRFVVCAWLASSHPARWQVRHLLEPICREGRLPGMGSAEEYQQLARGAGLSSLQFTDLSAQVSRTWPICAWRVLKGLILKPDYRRFLLSSGNPNRVFALTILRIWLAYRTGSMRYGILSGVKSCRVPAPHSGPAAGETRLPMAVDKTPE